MKFNIRKYVAYSGASRQQQTWAFIKLYGNGITQAIYFRGKYSANYPNR